MGVMIKNGPDVITFLKSQHDDIKSLLEQVAAASGQERTDAFLLLRRALAVHETAEEEIVHPAARRALPGGDAIVRARLDEENAAKRSLTELESLDVDSSEFTAKFGVFRMKVIAHTSVEERDEFAKLAIQLGPDRLDRMRKAAQIAEAIAPTRPHPGVESATANLLVGPFAAMMDRSRDALTDHKE